MFQLYFIINKIDVFFCHVFTSLIDYVIIIAYCFFILIFIIPTKDLDSLQFD
nr:MAG TPA: hypothetical protein [Caudoviricetes sp.]